MKQTNDLYQDVVVGGQLPVRTRSSKSKKSSEPKEEEKDSKESVEQTGKKGGKGDMEIGEMADRLASDPFLTPQEMKSMDGSSKVKEKKADESEDKSKSRQNEIKETKKDLDILVSRTEKILLSAKAIFPFDFFPNTITIDANKVNIKIKTFFFTETITSILIKEIMDVRVEVSLFMGKLIIDYGPHPLKISTVYVPTLWKSDALRAKEIIEGMLVIYRAENIDTTKLKPEETLEAIKEVGKVDEERP
ncbi:MAG TPA: hypothetical protein VNA13_00715 [Xanthomonadales bacterium]|nr:hypothetical protein [Xanthomonadales bacterium]